MRRVGGGRPRMHHLLEEKEVCSEYSLHILVTAYNSTKYHKTPSLLAFKDFHSDLKDKYHSKISQRKVPIFVIGCNPWTWDSQSPSEAASSCCLHVLTSVGENQPWLILDSPSSFSSSHFHGGCRPKPTTEFNL